MLEGAGVGALALAPGPSAAEAEPAWRPPAGKPDFVFVSTDDQSSTLNALRHGDWKLHVRRNNGLNPFTGIVDRGAAFDTALKADRNARYGS